MEKHPLHMKNPELQMSPEVESAVEKQERLTEEQIPNDPADRIEAYMDRLENIFLNPDERVRERNLEMLRDKIYDALITKKENFPDSYFELQQRIARERGQAVEVMPEATKEQMKVVAIEDQKHSLDAWMDYLTSPDAVYPAWFKYYVWKNITKLSQFDKERGEFKKRTSTTVAPFPDIYREPLAQIADLYEQVKNDNTALNEPEVKEAFSKKFPSLYAELIQESLSAGIENKENISGEWIKYAHGDTSEAETLYQSLEGKGTGWCTAGRSTAQTQIESGDFYVYYSNDANGAPTQPRLAIRMSSNKIGEVRGILPHQEVEPALQDILDDKLTEFGSEAESYQKKSADMKMLTSLERKAEKSEDFTKDDLRFLYEIDAKIEGFGYGKDPRIAELRSGRDVKTDISFVTGYEREKISTTQEEALSGGILFHHGDLDLESLTSAEGLTLPQSVGGYLNLSSLTSTEGLTLPQSVGGSLYLKSLTSAEGLTLPQSVGGSLYLYSLTSAEGLTLPQSVGGDLNLRSLTSGQGLTLPQSVGGDLNLESLTSAEGMTLPQTVGGDLNLRSLTSGQGLTLPQSVGGNLALYRLTSAEGLILPQSVGGYLNLESLTSTEGLTLPQSVGGSLYLKSLTSGQGLTLPQSVGGDLNLESLTSGQGLTLPQSVGGGLYLYSLTSAEGMTLPQTVGGDLNLYSLTSAEGLTLPQTVGGDLNLGSLTSAEGLTLPQTVGGYLNLRSLTSAEGMTLPESVGGDLNLNRLTKAEGLTLPQSVGGYLYLESLTSAEKNVLRTKYPKLSII